MDIDVNLRARAARSLLDAASVLDLDDTGTDEADSRMLLALEELGLPLENDPALAAFVAASTDLIWALTLVLSQWRNEPREATISTVREYLATTVYPDATA